MASNDTTSVAPEAKQGPNAQNLDEIANCMEDMLNNMKRQIKKSDWKNLCNKTFNSLDVRKAAVEKSSYINHKHVLETIHEDKVYEPVPPVETITTIEPAEKVSSSIAYITKTSPPQHSEKQINSEKNNIKSNINKQQNTKTSQKIPTNSIITNKLTKKNINKPTPIKKNVASTSGKHNPTIVTTVTSESTRPQRKLESTYIKSNGNGKLHNENKSKSSPSNIKQETGKPQTKRLVPNSVQLKKNKIDESNSNKKNEMSSALRSALTKIKLGTETKNKLNEKIEKKIEEKKNVNVNSDSTKQTRHVESNNLKQASSYKPQKATKNINEKNNTVIQPQNKKSEGTKTAKLQNGNAKSNGDNTVVTEVKTVIKIKNKTTEPLNKLQDTTKNVKDNFQTKQNTATKSNPMQRVKNIAPTTVTNVLNTTDNTVSSLNGPEINRISVSNQAPNAPTDNKLLIIPTDVRPPAPVILSSSSGDSIVSVITEHINIVKRAIKERKTFTITGGFNPIRRALITRGWIEKIRDISDDKETWKKLLYLSNIELAAGILTNAGEKYSKALLTKLLAGHQVDFYWDYMANPFTVNSDKVKLTVINRLPTGANKCYTSKARLCDSLHDSYWYQIADYANVTAPRTYNLGNVENEYDFIDDFHLTAAVSLLKWIGANANDTNKIMSDMGTIPMAVFNFAMLQVGNLIRIKEHRDIDENIQLPPNSEWDWFLEKYYKVVRNEEHFIESGKLKAPYMIMQAKYMMNAVSRYLPDVHVDGMMNLWLLKPHRGSCGSGILVCRTLQYMLDTVHTKTERKYVVQKYIERPLLIYNTKFDIRQWFLVTCMPYLNIWMYKDCYLRFSSQYFNLNKLDQSIHLTNNSVQCRYKNCERSDKLPHENMWHSKKFQKYLASIGRPNKWKNSIYNGMKEALVGLFMTCQDRMATRINSFELCGADFMVSEDFRPYLIEINARPALHPSTSVTAAMCPKVLKDVIRVTVDHARNANASTGNFELIYTDNLSYVMSKTNVELDTIQINGTSYSSLWNNQNSNKSNDEINKSDQKETKYSKLIGKLLNINSSEKEIYVRSKLARVLKVDSSEQDKSNEVKGNRTKLHNILSKFLYDISKKTEQEIVNKPSYGIS